MWVAPCCRKEANNMKREYLSSFAWCEGDEELHIDVQALLKEMGKADTPANRAACTRFVEEFFAQELPAATLIYLGDR
jgi:hypothetical protein